MVEPVKSAKDSVGKNYTLARSDSPVHGRLMALSESLPLSPREEEGGWTKSSRGLVRHLEEQESAQGVTGPARAREALSRQES